MRPISRAFRAKVTAVICFLDSGKYFVVSLAYNEFINRMRILSNYPHSISIGYKSDCFYSKRCEGMGCNDRGMLHVFILTRCSCQLMERALCRPLPPAALPPQWAGPHL